MTINMESLSLSYSVRPYFLTVEVSANPVLIAKTNNENGIHGPP